MIALASEIGSKIGLSTAGAAILTKLIGSTDERDWTDPKREPIFYGRQETLAVRLGISARQLRNHESKFIRLGLIERRTLANGGRDFRTGLGLILTPLIHRFSEFLKIRDDSRASAINMKQLKALRSVRKAEIKEQLARLSASDRATPIAMSIAHRAETWPRADCLLPMGEDALTRHLEDATALCIELDDWIKNHSDSSCEPERNFRSFIQEDTNQNLHVSCNDPVDNPIAGLPAQSGLVGSRPDVPDQGIEQKREAERAALQGLFESKYGLSHIVTLASEDFKFELAARSDRGLEYAFIDAAAARLKPLGINETAWDAACYRMGRAGAATCVLILDANLDHPTSPVRNPGGALRGMTKAYNRRTLNLIGSLIGLHRRRGG